MAFTSLQLLKIIAPDLIQPWDTVSTGLRKLVESPGGSPGLCDADITRRLVGADGADVSNASDTDLVKILAGDLYSTDVVTTLGILAGNKALDAFLLQAPTLSAGAWDAGTTTTSYTITAPAGAITGDLFEIWGYADYTAAQAAGALTLLGTAALGSTAQTKVYADHTLETHYKFKVRMKRGSDLFSQFSSVIDIDAAHI